MNVYGGMILIALIWLQVQHFFWSVKVFQAAANMQESPFD